MKTILVVAAHPDDEILGVGATVANLVDKGYKAYALILAEGQTSRWKQRKEASGEIIKELHIDALKAAKHIGYTETFFLNYPDNRMDSIDILDVVKSIEDKIKKIQPEIIFTHYSGDLNIDHQITSKAVRTATRPIGKEIVKAIYEFETVSSTEWNFGRQERCFNPNVFVDVKNTFQRKIDAMKCYQTELCEFPHPRSIEMLEVEAKRFGAMIGKECVEAFELVRELKEF